MNEINVKVMICRVTKTELGRNGLGHEMMENELRVFVCGM